VPFAIRGYHGDDSQFHFSSWIGLRQAWLAGDFAPGWDALANYTLGDPRFCFYPPLSLWLGASLSTILPFNLAPAAFVWLALVMSGLSMHVASKSIVGSRYRSLAALLYMASPYVLMAAITRFAAAELLVLAWMPLIVLHFLRATASYNRRSTLLLACLLALSWLTNIPASIVLTYVLLFVAVIAAVQQRSSKALLPFLIAESIALLAAAFSLAPAFFESQWITTSALLHQNFREYFVFGSISSFQRMHFELGLWVISFAEVAVIVTSIVSRERLAYHQYRLLYELAAIAFLFELPLATVCWLYLPELRFVQFPFRFLSVLGAVLPLIVIGNGIDRKVMNTSCGLMALLALLPLIFYLRINPDTPSDLPDLSSEIRLGYSGTAEYTPVGAVTRNTPIALTPVSVASDFANSRCTLSDLSNGPRLKLISVEAESLCHVRFATYFYPYWEAKDEGGKSFQTSRDDAGLLVVAVPRGQHTIQVRFHAHSPARIISMAISAVAALFLVIGLLKYSWKSTSEPHVGNALSALARREEKAAVPTLYAVAIELPTPRPEAQI
jgi:hypothetical protein